MVRTQTRSIVGTPMYMAPEQIRGQQMDHRCDIYAMGCTLYALLTGAPPFTDDKVGVLLKNHLYEPPVPPTARVHGARRAAIPPELERATLRCLAKEPELRLQSMRELVVRRRRVGAASGGRAHRSVGWSAQPLGQRAG